MSTFKQFGERIAEVQDKVLEKTEHVARAREELDFTLTIRSTGRRNRWLFAAVAATACVAVGIAAVFMTRPEPLTLTVSYDDEPGMTGQWIYAPAGEEVPIRFSDGTVVELQPKSGARVVEVNDRGAKILIEQGTAAVKVVHRSDSDWRLDVGPFDVHVTGTEFDVSWIPERQRFTLSLEEGEVLVTGPMISGGRRVGKGQVLNVWVAEKRVEIKNRDEEQTLARARKERATEAVLAPVQPDLIESEAGDKLEPQADEPPLPSHEAGSPRFRFRL